MPLDVPPPRTSRFGSPLVLSRVHWVRPELVVEVKYLSWTDDNLLRQVIYQGLREDKPPSEVRRPVPHPKSTALERRLFPRKSVDPVLARDIRSSPASFHDHNRWLPRFAMPWGNIYDWGCVGRNPKVLTQIEEIGPRGFVARYWRPAN
jgi:bifunctional non-homologous end joining protein LigD